MTLQQLNQFFQKFQLNIYSCISKCLKFTVCRYVSGHTLCDSSHFGEQTGHSSDPQCSLKLQSGMDRLTSYRCNTDYHANFSSSLNIHRH